MPPGAPQRRDPGGTRPARLLGFRGLPQHEIHRIALIRGDLDARARDHLVERAAGERAVARRSRQRVHRRGRKQHVVFRDIGDPARDEPFDHRAHPVDILRGARLVSRVEAAERPDVVTELALGRLGDFCDRLIEWEAWIFALGARVDLVVDVSHISGVDHVVRAVDMTQQSEQQVENDDRPSVADMGVVIDRRAANVEPDRAWVDRREILLAAGQRVIKAQRHRRLRRLPARLRSSSPPLVIASKSKQSTAASICSLIAGLLRSARNDGAT